MVRKRNSAVDADKGRDVKPVVKWTDDDGRSGDPCPKCGAKMYIQLFSGARYLLCSNNSCLRGGK